MKNKILSALMTMMVIVGLFAPMESYADNSHIRVDAQFTSGYTQGQTEATLKATVTNTTDKPITDITVRVDSGQMPSGANGIKPSGSIKTSLDGKETKEFLWTIDITGATLGQDYRFEVSATWSNYIAYDTSTLKVEPSIDENEGKPNLPNPSNNEPNFNVQSKLEVIAPSGGLNSGTTNSIQLKVTNNGNARFSNVVASITPGEKMTLKNASLEQRIGNIERNETGIASFPVHIDSTHTGGNIPITFTVKGTDPTGKEATFAITEYVTVNAGTSQVDKLEIINIQNPQSVAMDQTFSLKFAVRNNSSETAKNIKVTVEPTAPIVNKSKNIYIITLAGGESKAFDIQLFAAGNAEVQSQNYPIKITAETTDKEPIGISQYAGVFVNGDNKTKTVPQIIITNYTYGGSSVVANEVFPLSLVLKNTNSSQTLRNIKVSLTADEGIFIPHNSSNSFYIDKIGANASIRKTIELMTKPDAPEKTVSINVDMSYEDSKGNPVTVKDIISVPVIQQRKIVIDDVNPIDPIFQGEDSNISVQYYNMGKSTLNNLVITAESEQLKFTQNPKSFIGKFEPGKSGSYDFTFVADKTGEVKGKLLITFEDSNGKEVKMDKPFTFMVEEPIAPPENEMINEIPEPEKGGKMKKVLIGAGVVTAIVVAGIVIKKIRKKKFDDSLDIGNE
ncbi:MAG: hypothetical protein Q4D65_02370 [Peptostreptococcaceae bacterium]|nr:hypothetical protein [Peptostreptococcaceae bacterium]